MTIKGFSGFPPKEIKAKRHRTHDHETQLRQSIAVFAAGMKRS
jgi:hypothetical protein